MDENIIKSLLNKNKGDLLTEDEQVEVKKLKVFCKLLLMVDGSEYNPDYCYCYARLAKLKIIREKKDVVDRLLSIVASNTLSNESEQSLYDKYPLAYEYMDK